MGNLLWLRYSSRPPATGLPSPLVSAGKEKGRPLAAMRKLLTILNAIVKQQTPWRILFQSLRSKQSLRNSAELCE